MAKDDDSKGAGSASDVASQHSDRRRSTSTTHSLADDKPAAENANVTAEEEEDAVVDEHEVHEEFSHEELSALEEELEQINVSTNEIVIDVAQEVFDSADFPESYKLNCNKEKLVLTFAENFRKQFVHLYRDRKPLFLNPRNELDVEKFVCTTIQPTELPFNDLYNWHGVAEFVADYLSFVPLNPAHELPTRLLSPATVLKLQRGSCFEYSTVLASLLIGAGYDAYVVSGYATKETCLMDEAKDICPLLKPVEEEKPEEVKPPTNKYTVRPPKDLRSKYEMKMEQRRLKLIADEEEKIRKEEEEKRLALVQPEVDWLYGLRIHSWVLVLEGKREVPQGFFIEPLTGLAHPLDSQNYLGIESVWNHKNYWVNMQDCSEGVTKLRYDLGDCADWEFMFPSNEKPLLVVPGDSPEEEDDTNQSVDADIEKHLDLPPSWTKPLTITHEEYTLRCPHGKKTKLYKQAKLEKFAPYVLKDGLVQRLSVYADTDMTSLTEVREVYANRVDRLRERHYDYITEWITEQFSEGRTRNLQEHRYRLTGGLMPEGERTMTFYHAARVDGLESRIETPSQMTENFINRDDFLIYRHVVFGTRQKKFGPAETTSRPIELMIERYNRNESKDANDDIAEVVFNLVEEKICVTCHRENSKISATTREFIKPSATDDKGDSGIVWSTDSYTAFLSDANKKDKKRVEIYQMMMDLLKAEERCTTMIRQSEDEVKDILDDRMREEATSELSISIYDTMRNDKAKKHREMLEKLQKELEAQREEKDLDYLQPFLAKLSPDDIVDGKLTRQQAFGLRQECLADLKQRLIDRANLIQARFEKETQELQKRQSWYQQNQVSMQKADEQEYLSYCNDAMFRIHILEQRLNRHKELAPLRYMALEQKIRSDPRLAAYF